ncbi:MAG: hypothetical protein WC815_00845 [Vicinamibacterales bacterium]|jgi:hypothetical protein
MLVETLTQLSNTGRAIDLRDTLVKDRQSKLEALPKTRAEVMRSGLSRTEVDRKRADLEHELWQLENGATAEQGISSPELELLVGKPGLRWLRVQKGRLEREVEQLRDLEAKWPTPETKCKFRYTGKPNKFRWPTDEDPYRHLERGDVVELTKARAMALRDLFEAVDETVTVG